MKIRIKQEGDKISPENFRKLLQWSQKFKQDINDAESVEEKLEALQTFIILKKIVSRHLTRTIKTRRMILENRERQISRIIKR